MSTEELREAARRALFSESKEGEAFSDRFSLSLDKARSATERCGVVRGALKWALQETACRETLAAVCRVYVAETEADHG